MGEKLYRCDVCDWYFLYFIVVINYKWIYIGEKLYVCVYEGCGKCFVD